MEKETINKLIENVTGINGDFYGDLNAMHEAEKALTPVQLKVYAEILCEDGDTVDTAWMNAEKGVCSTAAQRAEAFLRTIGKWDDSK